MLKIVISDEEIEAKLDKSRVRKRKKTYGTKKSRLVKKVSSLDSDEENEFCLDEREGKSAKLVISESDEE